MSGTAEEIMDIAEGLIRSRGFQGFAFREIASTVGIKSASVHYHFPTKGDLAQAVLDRYAARFEQALNDIDAKSGSVSNKLKSYVALYRSEMSKDKNMTVSMMLTADVAVLPETVVKALQDFQKLNIRWLSNLIKAQQAKADAKTVKRKASLVLAALHGGLMGARSLDNKQYFEQVVNELESIIK